MFMCTSPTFHIVVSIPLLLLRTSKIAAMMASFLTFTILAHLSSVSMAKPTEPMITPLAQLVPREDNLSFIGWNLNSTENTYEANYCDSDYIFSTSDLYVQCCPKDGDCVFTTACEGKVAKWRGGTSSCSQKSCNTDSIFATTSADTDAKLWIGCNDSPPAFYFQVKPSVTSSSSPSPTSAQSTASAGATGPSTASSTNAPSRSSQTPAATSSALLGASEKGSSTPGIVGGVVGGLAFLAIAGGLLFWFLRRRKHNKGQSYQPAPGKNPYDSQSYLPAHATAPYDPQPYNPATVPTHATTPYDSQPYNQAPAHATAPYGPQPTGPTQYHPQVYQAYQSAPIAAQYVPPSHPPSPNPPPPQASPPLQEYNGQFAPAVPVQEEQWKHEANRNSGLPATVSPPPQPVAPPPPLEVSLPGANIGELSSHNDHVAELPGSELATAPAPATSTSNQPR
ncbi:hypothetical protein BCR34DRAFT_2544 [Clohesyomyces aquaticus]|uniref:Uncharacterized protein n=1 Tax=Clohesyomyces aquaticus TaxID=1231657 RepID=A0A1Y2AB76_9PLEO|nr:hypothetical protein BCR34DRAFT_2544 [Clohesyomyces aquaticus]